MFPAVKQLSDVSVSCRVFKSDVCLGSFERVRAFPMRKAL
jgi:hypothetical protein